MGKSTLVFLRLAKTRPLPYAFPVKYTLILYGLCLSLSVPAAVPSLLDRLEDENARGQNQWIYNDLQQAMAEARSTGKPIFVTFRCVPCKACKAFDAEVARGNNVIRDLAEKHFITLRQVEMKGVDLSLFQFDYDLNWAGMFINADGVVYARYGTQSTDGPDAYNSIAGLKNTMDRVLKLHAAYPANKVQLAGKRGAPKPYKTAMEMPGLENKQAFRQTTHRNNCIHCHNIHDAENHKLHLEGKLTKDKLWRYPLPENVGLNIDAVDGQLIAKVLSGSAADRAGLKAGQRITHANGQPITSIADIQWVLHNLSNSKETIRFTVAGSSRALAVQTDTDWKKTDISWRGSLWALHPRIRVYFPEATANDRRQLKLPANRGALKVKWINTGSKEGRAAHNAGLRLNDYVMGIAGKPFDPTINHRKFNLHVKMNYKSGQKLPLDLIRNGRKIRLDLPLQ